jgi:hypothetical protein
MIDHLAAIVELLLTSADDAGKVIEERLAAFLREELLKSKKIGWKNRKTIWSILDCTDLDYVDLWHMEGMHALQQLRGDPVEHQTRLLSGNTRVVMERRHLFHDSAAEVGSNRFVALVARESSPIERRLVDRHAVLLWFGLDRLDAAKKREM